MPFTANVDKHFRPSLMRVVIGQTRGLDKHPSMRSTKLKTQERACLFSIAGHGHESHRRPVFCGWTHARLRNRSTQVIGVLRIAAKL